jgi:ectoine hydroxylase-related dioxygenase (phytanoyl-CoA dioxygenase family)
VWHQDTALPLREKRDVAGWGPWSTKDGVLYAHAPAEALEQVVALRVHLDDSTADNGPLRVVPGSHMGGVLSDAQIHDLVARSKPIACVVPQGGVLAMRPLIVHASSKATGGGPRRVLHIEYASQTRFDGGLELAVA